MPMTNTLKLVSALLVALLLVACGGQPEPAVEEAPAEEEAPADEPVEEETMDEEEAMDEEMVEEEEMAEEEMVEAPEGTVAYAIIPAESSAQYSVDELFLDENRGVTAVGVTTEISGTIFVDEANPQNSSMTPIMVDISALESDSARRDGAIRERFLESDTFPIATFTPTEITGLPETYTAGEELSLQVTGDFVVREITQEVTWDVIASVVDGQLVGSATTVVLLSDFGAGPISIAGILETEDEAALTLNFVAEPAS